MNKEFWIGLTVVLLILAVGVCVVATVAKTSPGKRRLRFCWLRQTDNLQPS